MARASKPKLISVAHNEIGDADAFMRAYEAARRSLDASVNCPAYELSRCTESLRRSAS